MDRYNRAYRDAKSPLTPLTPLSGRNVFNFDLGGDSSLDHKINDAVLNLSTKASPALAPAPDQLQARPKRFSEEFLKRRNVFERSRAIQLCAPRLNVLPAAAPHHAAHKAKPVHLQVPPAAGGVGRGGRGGRGAAQLSTPQRRHQQPASHPPAMGGFRRASPIVAKPLSPRIAKLLTRTDMWKYGGLFQREEIDMEVFRLLTQPDLLALGIQCRQDITQILRAIRYAHHHY